jgi:uncharacterized protein (DUF58 family)
MSKHPHDHPPHSGSVRGADIGRWHVQNRRPRRRYQFGAPGLLYVGVTLLVAVGAFNSQNNLLFLTFGLALALLVLSGIISGAMLMGLDVVREPTADLYADAPATLRYRVRNRNRWMSCFAITIEERALAGPESIRPTLAWRALSWVLRRLRIAAGRAEPVATAGSALGPSVGFVEHLPARSERTIEAIARAEHRGVVRLSVIRVRSSFPFGLIRKLVEFEQPAELIVRPVLKKVAPINVGPGGGGEAHAARSRGLGEEFYAIRDYQPGDPLKIIAWRASARRDKLQVKQTAAAASARLWIEVGLDPRATKASATEAAISTAAGTARQAFEQGLAFALAVPLTGLAIPLGRGQGHLALALDELGRLEVPRVGEAGDHGSDRGPARAGDPTARTISDIGSVASNGRGQTVVRITTGDLDVTGVTGEPARTQEIGRVTA